jgi:MoaA/NifB/PqqE/SkfB family radical SAM enzyme
MVTEFDWQKTRNGTYRQIIPTPAEPGNFTMRVLITSSYQRIPAVPKNPKVETIQVFVQQSDGTAAWAVPKSDSGKTTELINVTDSSFPDLPQYPFWTHDRVRSRQVIAGNYDEIVPLTFEFIPTLNCIYRCHECAYRTPKEKLGIWEDNVFDDRFHMSLATMQTLLDKLKGAGVVETLFTGGGEPLLNSATPDAMRYAAQIGLRVGLYTNGALMTAGIAKHLVQSDVAYVRVSLNAGSADVHKLHHNALKTLAKTDYLEDTITGIELMAENKEAESSKMVLGVSYLVDPQNVDDAINGAKLISGIARKHPGMINYMRFTPSVNYYGPQQHAQEVFERAVSMLRSRVSPVLEENGVESTIYGHRFRGLYQTRPYDRCLAYGFYGGVGPGGIAYHCCERLFNTRFDYGNMCEHSFEDIWNGRQRRYVLDTTVKESVIGKGETPCPVVCKPHELNKVFNEIERIRDRGQIERVEEWLEAIHTILDRSKVVETFRPKIFGFESKL